MKKGSYRVVISVVACLVVTGALCQSSSSFIDKNEKYSEKKFTDLYALLSTRAFDSANHVLTHLVHETHALADQQCYIHALILHGELLRNNHYPAEALTAAYKAHDLARSHHFPRLEAEALFLEAKIFHGQDKTDKALELYYASADLFRSTSQPSRAFDAYMDAGHLQYAADDFAGSIKTINKGLLLVSDEKQDQVRNAWNTIGLAYFRMKNYDSARRALKNSQRKALETQNEFWFALTSGNLGKIDMIEKEYDSALHLYALDKKISLKYGEWQSAAGAFTGLGNAYAGKKQWDKAFRMYDSAEWLIDEHHMLLPSYYRTMWQIHDQQGNQRKAYVYLQKYLSQKDTIDGRSDAKRQSGLKNGIDFEARLTEIDMLKQENQLKEQQLKTQNLRLFASLAILALTVISLFMLYKNNLQRRRMNAELEDKVKERTRELMSTNRELDTFLYRSSHDIRRPITTLLGLDYLGKQIVADEPVREILDKVGLTARNMDNMLKKLQSVYEVNRNVYPERLKSSVYVMMKEVINELDLAKCSTLNFNVEEVRGITLATDPGLFRIIFSNLLENAVQHKIPGRTPRITVQAGLLDNVFFLTVIDQGRGMSEDVLSRIYEPFFKGNDQATGSGLGLYLVKKSIERLKGDIRVTSTFGEGTTFNVLLPDID